MEVQGAPVTCLGSPGLYVAHFQVEQWVGHGLARAPVAQGWLLLISVSWACSWALCTSAF